jgi:hypothetical protein
MTYYVYAYLRNTDSETAAKGTPYYIGKGKDRRAVSDHGNTPVPTDKQNIVFLKEYLTEQDAHNYEIELIAKYGRKDLGTGILLNRTNGGEGGSGHIQIPWNKGLSGVQTPWNKGLTKDTDERIAEYAKVCNEGRKGAKQSPETIAKRSAAMIGKNKGKERSEEWRKNHSEKMTGRESKLKGKPSPLKGRDGRKWTDAEKEFFSAIKKGKPWTEARKLAQQRRKENGKSM